MSRRKIFQKITGLFLFIIICFYPLNIIAEYRAYQSLLAQTGQSEPYIRESDPPSYFYSSINRTGFIRKKPVIPNGSIFKAKDDKTLISAGDIVYIKPMRNSQIVLGGYYTVYRTMDPMTAGEKEIKSGTQYYLTGVVEITEKNPRFVIAKVIRSFRSIAVDDLLMPYTEKSPKILLTESKPDIDGEIIGPEEHSVLIGEHSVVFLNKGSRNGLMPGQYYNVYYQEKAQIVKDSVPLDSIDFGTLLVLHTEDDTATAVVIKSERNIYPGIKFHTPGE